MGPRAGLDRCGKSRLSLGFDRRAVHPIARTILTELPCPLSGDADEVLHEPTSFLMLQAKDVHKTVL